VLQPDGSLLWKYSALNYCSKVTQYIPHVDNIRGEIGMDFQEDPFPGNRESDKKVHCCTSKVLIITDEQQQNLRCV
jgi:hypothetical protein